MENNIISYFSKIYNNHKFEFLKKNNGRQSGNILKIIDLFNNYETIYYLKTHQDGSTYLSSTKYHLDIKELYIYKLLYNLNIGPEVHWFGLDISSNSIYIATKELTNNDLDEKEIIKLDIITRILRLNDVMSNKSNILQHNDKKGYIIDFRILKIIGRKNPYLYDNIYDSFINGNETINYDYNNYFNKIMSPENNENKIKYFKNIIYNEINNFINITNETYEEIKNDIIIKKYDNTDLLIYIDDIKSNYKNLKNKT